MHRALNAGDTIEVKSIPATVGSMDNVNNWSTMSLMWHGLE